MTEPENFEDDLFADLYDDNDASAPQVATKQENKPSAEFPASLQTEAALDQSYSTNDQNGGYNDEDHDDNYDDDDDVDFNLGNNSANPVSSSIGINASAVPAQQEVSTPSYHSAKGPSAKEDG